MILNDSQWCGVDDGWNFTNNWMALEFVVNTSKVPMQFFIKNFKSMIRGIALSWEIQHGFCLALHKTNWPCHAWQPSFFFLFHSMLLSCLMMGCAVFGITGGSLNWWDPPAAASVTASRWSFNCLSVCLPSCQICIQPCCWWHHWCCHWLSLCCTLLTVVLLTAIWPPPSCYLVSAALLLVSHCDFFQRHTAKEVTHSWCALVLANNKVLQWAIMAVKKCRTVHPTIAENHFFPMATIFEFWNLTEDPTGLCIFFLELSVGSQRAAT